MKKAVKKTTAPRKKALTLKEKLKIVEELINDGQLVITDFRPNIPEVTGVIDIRTRKDMVDVWDRLPQEFTVIDGALIDETQIIICIDYLVEPDGLTKIQKETLLDTWENSKKWLNNKDKQFVNYKKHAEKVAECMKKHGLLNEASKKNSGHDGKCVICHENYVDVEDGYDTCQECLKKI